MKAADLLAWQPALFAPSLNRFALLKLGATTPSDAPRLRVLRNHAVESLATAAQAFLTYAGTPLKIVAGEYDDSLPMPVEEAVCELVWLDFDRYGRLTDEDLAAWITGRLGALRQALTAPLVVANAPGAEPRHRLVNRAIDGWADGHPGVAVLRLDAIAARLGHSFFDDRRAETTGTRYSDQAALQAARALAFEVLPRFLGAPVRALAVDLDNTLYSGVLGEDGVEGVELTADHAALQTAVAELAGRGVLVSVISRNEAQDVEALFAARPDFPLRSEHVADWQVGWDAKSRSIAAAATAFNVAPDAFLMIDDNLGELVEAAAALPGLRLLFAGPTAQEAVQALRGYPGLWQDRQAFGGRTADVVANRARETLATAAFDDAAYLAELQAELSLNFASDEDRARLVDMSRKTNQFNLALRRLSELEVARYIDDPDRAVVHVRLADRLADSGSVAAVFVRREGATALVEELCISCRALGRRLEDTMVSVAVAGAAGRLGAETVAFDYALGPRNAPARDWLAAFSGAALEEGCGRIVMPIPAPAPDGPVTIKWKT